MQTTEQDHEIDAADAWRFEDFLGAADPFAAFLGADLEREEREDEAS